MHEVRAQQRAMFGSLVEGPRHLASSCPPAA